MNSTNVFSSHWFCFVWLIYSGNKFSRVHGFQIFQKNVFWEEPILGGSKLNVTVQLVPLYVLSSNMAAISLASQTLPSSADHFQYPPCDDKVDKIRVDSTWQHVHCRHVACGIRALKLIYLFTLSLVKPVHAIELPSLASQTLSVPQHRSLSVCS